MKRLSAMWFSLVLVWVQLPAAPAPACSRQPVCAGCDCGGKMSCCSAPSSGSQPMPAVPSSAGAQKQLSISAPASVAVARSENRVGLICPASRLASMPDGTPLYARDCARLL